MWHLSLNLCHNFSTHFKQPANQFKEQHTGNRQLFHNVINDISVIKGNITRIDNNKKKIIIIWVKKHQKCESSISFVMNFSLNSHGLNISRALPRLEKTSAKSRA